MIKIPKKLKALAILKDPTILKGKSAIKIGNALKTHAHLGSPVLPDTITTNNVMVNKRKPI